MKNTLAIFALASILMAGAAWAGSLSDPIVAPEVVAADAVQSAASFEGILAALAVIAIILGAASAF